MIISGCQPRKFRIKVFREPELLMGYGGEIEDIGYERDPDIERKFIGLGYFGDASGDAIGFGLRDEAAYLLPSS